MGDSGFPYQKLPPGWDCKTDKSTGSCYYINYFTRAMQLEDPRQNYRQLQSERCSNESIPMQPVHSSPYHVFPSNTMTAMRAFHNGPARNPSLHNYSVSPLLSSRGHLEMSPLLLTKSSVTNSPHTGQMSRRSTIQETSFSNRIDTNAVVGKIQNMFPTASENHIRLLLKKYYNREAVVISALQVEKHPVTMPGPFVTPPAQRHLYHSNSAVHMTHGSSISMHSSAKSGIGLSAIGCSNYGYVPLPSLAFHGSPRFGEQWRNSPKPHSSPKMKLRYMKNIFPKADEMLLLDILTSTDNNVQKASEKLLSMGYMKRDYMTPKVTYHQNIDTKMDKKHPDDIKIIPLRPKEYTEQDKLEIKHSLEKKYPQIAERIILMAMESVNYSEDRAAQILQIVCDEDEMRKQQLEQQNSIFEKQQQTIKTLNIKGIEDNTMSKSVDNLLKLAVENGAKEYELIETQKLSTLYPNKNVSTSETANTQKIFSCLSTCNISDAVSSAAIVKNCHNEHKKNSISKDEDNGKLDEGNDIDTTNINISSTLTLSSVNCITSLLSLPPPSALPLPKSAPSLSSSSSITSSEISTKSILAKTNSFSINKYLNGSTKTSSTVTTTSSNSLLEKLKLKHRNKSNALKNSQRSSIDDEVDCSNKTFESLVGHVPTKGHNVRLAKGADENLLLADYVTWNGANSNIALGHNPLAKGSDKNLLNERICNAIGHDPALTKGAQNGLAKGSIYTRLSTSGNNKSQNIKCN